MHPCVVFKKHGASHRSYKCKVQDLEFRGVPIVERVQMEPTRTWSCSTLLRGSSFLEEQLADNGKRKSFDDIVGVSRLQSNAALGVPATYPGDYIKKRGAQNFVK